MSVTAERKQELVQKFGSGVADTGAPEVQIALLTELITEKGKDFTQDDLRGQTTVFVFYPFAFSPVCTDQLNVYNEVLEEFAGRGARLYGVSCDASWSQAAFRKQ